MFNAEEEDWMPDEEGTTPVNGNAHQDAPAEKAAGEPAGVEENCSTPFDDDTDAGTLPVEAPGGEPDVRERAVSVDGGAKPTPSLEKLIILVTEPQREGEGQLAYVSYNVKCSSKRSNLNDGEVRRRYSDFEWLNKQLERENPMRIIPQIPGKLRTKQLSRFEDEFIERRRYLLNYFVGRIASNDVLSQSPCFISFIQQSVAEFATTKKTAEKTKTIKAALTVVNTLRLKPTNERFQQIRVSVSDLMTQLAALDKSIESTRTHFMNVATEMNEATPIFTEIGKIEPVLEHAMESLDKAVALVVQEAVDKSEDETSRVIEKLTEFHKLCEAVLALLTRRDLAEHAYDKASDDVNKKTTEQENVEREGAKSVLKMFSKKDPAELKREKLAQISSSLVDLREKLDHSEKMLKTWNYTVLQEIEQFEVIKIRDLKQIFTMYTKINLNFHSRSKTAFEKAMPPMATISVPSKK